MNMGIKSIFIGAIRSNFFCFSLHRNAQFSYTISIEQLRHSKYGLSRILFEIKYVNKAACDSIDCVCACLACETYYYKFDVLAAFGCACAECKQLRVSAGAQIHSSDDEDSDDIEYQNAIINYYIFVLSYRLRKMTKSLANNKTDNATQHLNIVCKIYVCAHVTRTNAI